RLCDRHPRRSRAELPWTWHAAADTFVGSHAQRITDTAGSGAAARDLARRLDRPVGAGLQPAGRRLARRARPQAHRARAVGAAVILSGPERSRMGKDPRLSRLSGGDGSFVVPPQDDILIVEDL